MAPSIYELAALGAAICWAVTAIMAPGPVAHLGSVAYVRIRMTMVLAMLAAFVAWTGVWLQAEAIWLWPILASGFIGIFIGDVANSSTLARLGPRRTSILFSTNAPMAVVLGWLLFNETLAPRELAGIALVFAGVSLAIVFGKRRSQLHTWESVKGPLWIGVGIGLASALAQAAGSLSIKPVMASGADPVLVSMLRVSVAVACFQAIAVISPVHSRPRNPPTARILLIVGFAAFLAMAVGVTLLLFALSGGQVGIVSTLSATTPALVLPLVWLKTRERPAAGAWVGAALAVAGSGLIFSV